MAGNAVNETAAATMALRQDGRLILLESMDMKSLLVVDGNDGCRALESDMAMTVTQRGRIVLSVFTSKLSLWRHARSK